MSYKNEEVKKKVLDVLFKNHNKNLFSSQVRELIAQQVADGLVLDKSSKDRNITENGIVFDHGKTGNPINKPEEEVKEVKKETTKKVVKSEKPVKKQKEKRRGRRRTSVVNKPVEKSSGLKNLKNK